MKRDWDLVRLILERIEAMPPESLQLRPEDFQELSVAEVSYHFHLLSQAGLIEASISQSIGMPRYGIARSLTWPGHEFLDAIRSDTVWGRVKETAAQKGLDLTVDLIGALAKSILFQMAGLP